MLKDINSIYKYCTTYSIKVHEVYDQQTYLFSTALKKFQAMLYASDQIEIWKNFTGRLKRYRYLISVSPLPPNSAVFDTSLIHKYLSGFLKLQQSGSDGSSQIIVAANNLLSLFQNVSSERINKLDDRFRLLIRDRNLSYGMAIALLEHNLVKPVKIYFNEVLPHNSFEVISIHELKKITAFKKIILFGAPAWLENKGYSFLFSSPRSSTLDFISYSWVKNTVNRESAFDCAKFDSKILNAEKSKIEFERDKHADKQDIEDADTYLPVPDISYLKSRLTQSTSAEGSDDIEEAVNARIIILTGNKAVFIEAEKDSKSFVLNLNEEGHNDNEPDQNIEDEEDDDVNESSDMLGRYFNDDLQEGMFLLLRTGGGGDFIVPVADKILGDMKIKCRGMQKQWKDLLKSKIKEHGIEKVRKMIISAGGTNVHVATIRNWANERNIRPGTPQNFKALLHMLGIEHEFDKYDENAEIILAAHRKAGMHIRRLLIQQIKKSDMKSLLEEGIMRFNLTDIDTCASMTAYRIERILDEIHEVPYYKLGHPVDIGVESWQ